MTVNSESAPAGADVLNKELKAEESLTRIKEILNLYLEPEKLSTVDMGWRELKGITVLMTYIVYSCKIVGRLSLTSKRVVFARNSKESGLYEDTSSYRLGPAGELATVTHVLQETWNE